MATSKKLKIMNEENLIRSATQPDTMVAAVAAKTSWKKNFAYSGIPVQFRDENTPLYASPVAGLLSAPEMKNPFVPNIELPSPNMRAKPNIQNARDETATTPKFL